MKRAVIVLLLVLLTLTLVFTVSINSDKQFDKCENAKYFTNQYNPEYYNQASAEFYNEVKIKILKECGLIGAS